jgi:hypothetical protein
MLQRYHFFESEDDAQWALPIHIKNSFFFGGSLQNMKCVIIILLKTLEFPSTHIEVTKLLIFDVKKHRLICINRTFQRLALRKTKISF